MSGGPSQALFCLMHLMHAAAAHLGEVLAAGDPQRADGLGLNHDVVQRAAPAIRQGQKVQGRKKVGGLARGGGRRRGGLRQIFSPRRGQAARAESLMKSNPSRFPGTVAIPAAKKQWGDHSPEVNVRELGARGHRGHHEVAQVG